MASVTVSYEDVESRALGFDLGSRFTKAQVETQITDAVDDADGLWGSKIEERLTSGRLTANRYKRVIADAVLRVLRNPEGYTSENDGSYGYGKRADVASGSLFFTDSDRERLTGSASGMIPGTVRMSLDQRIH
ncbi:Gp19/Gp15/Gp42 family protein [Rathayibacter sp. Leaf248]|uniref:Gp19/Gp15/Gp42 family protein n=1 Tax=Rathayibacter sp. Leaf248 TaxID=2876555 RepID=UPI001E4A1912|nr:Gp19/Gp15/Gp42 family protein [Rathayibacter sp. Leaf248]